ncbi:MAG: hypothetical protein A2W90_24195 [Bacteroidetes bacterium GWF2_42_66]|nr:MAG: hypothetical protein A2W92_15305 [Bacteroidetes bacterium GWA2_42_15]OFX97972.1 MAG: hypothetical protein A2W89_07905 [Bacteroidetes bacterium GWE2_42_39]OFY45791.1 MAG: hypothetical protein A2W90_24195 [Bacteroidetes bacterium GWF2_42_66]HBL74709.1 hypothetical protein [Prolixibacteraceae bacterium]HCR89414.1 hypothetical protein [Prolixibacteraceae bacterium]
MKINKTLLLLLFLIVSGIATAQSKSYKIYDSFSEMDGVSQFSFSKNMLDVVNIDLDDEGKTITGDLYEIRFLSYNPQKGEMNGSQFTKKAMALLPSSYSKIDIEDDDVEAWMLGNKKKATEFHLFIKNDSPESMHFLVSFYGNFNIDDMDKLTHIGIDLSKNDEEK